MNNFLKANQKWIAPTLAMLIVVMVPSIAEMSGNSILLPSWFISLTLTLGMLSAGFGAYITDTLAARIIRIVMPACLLSLAVYKFFG